MKIAIVHDWINGMRGGERVLDTFLRRYPDADVFTLFHEPGATNALIDGRVKETSWLNAIPGARRRYRAFLPLFPSAARSFRFSGYDLVISLSHAAAKNITVPGSIPHVCYCFTPMRYIWDQAPQYLGRALPYARPYIEWLRRWDRAGAQRLTEIIGISRFISARIRCFYGRRAPVIYPPVSTEWIVPAKQNSQGEAFLLAGALVPYKRADLVIDTFNRLKQPLWVVGSGPLEAQLRQRAGAHIEFFGRVPDAVLADFYRRCRALLFPVVEDFGIVPLECLAAGRPVIALDDGALRETLPGIRPWLHGSGSALADPQACGVFMRKAARDPVEALASAVRYFLDHEGEFKVVSAVDQASSFGPERFWREWDACLALHGIQSTGMQGRSAQVAESKSSKEVHLAC